MRRKTILPLLALGLLFGSAAQGQECCGKLEKELDTVESRTKELEGEAREIGPMRRQVDKHEDEIDKNQEGILANRNRFEGVENQIRQLGTDLGSAKGTIDTQGGQIEKNKTGIEQNTEKISGNQQEITDINVKSGLTKDELNRFWVLIAAVLVFLMQAGFKALEVGMVRQVHRDSVGMKNLLDWLVVSVAFYVVGFGLMFGTSFEGFFGSSLFLPSSATMTGTYKLEFFLFQLAFAGTAATIVSGAISERAALTSYLLSSVLIATLIYPIVGHWIWGSGYIEGNTAWLADLGFHDFAGGTVVHSLGAWVALVGVWLIGPRKGRFTTEDRERFEPSDLGYSVLGVIILWVGWWGFNGGSVLEYDDRVSFIILNTNIAAAFAGLTAFLHALKSDPEQAYGKLIGGVLGGLVAITPCCDIVTPGASIVIGIVAGLVHNFAFDWLIRLRLDDPVGAIPVHGACGVWGTLAIGIFGAKAKICGEFLGADNPKVGLAIADSCKEAINTGLIHGGGLDQLLTQALGVGVVFVFTTLLSVAMFKLIDATIGLRISPEQEESGFVLVPKRPER